MTTNQDRAAEVMEQAWCEQSRSTKPEGLDERVETAWESLHANLHKITRDESVMFAQALTDAGLLTPDLPTDNAGGMGSGEWSAWFEYEGYSDGNITAIHQAHTSAWAPGWISLSAPRRMTTDQAEAVALALLAAVRSDRQIAASRATREKK